MNATFVIYSSDAEALASMDEIVRRVVSKSLGTVVITPNVDEEQKMYYEFVINVESDKLNFV
jgi:hypothetical protein